MAGAFGDEVALAGTPAHAVALSTVGRPSALATQATLDIIPIGARWLDAVQGRDAKALARSLRDAVRSDETLPTVIYETGFRAHLAGQLMVRGIEVDGEDPGASVLGSALLRAPGDTFLSLPFDEAVAFFREKHLLTEAEFDSLQDRYRRGGFIARDLASDRMEQVAHDLIARLLEQGLTIDDVRRQLRDAESQEAASLGVTPASSGYLENVIQTNVATSYGAGRWQAMNDPAVIALRPWQQFRTAGDSRVRAGHRSLDGLVFRAGSDLAARYAPPLYYRCRCTMVTLSDRQFRDRGLTETIDRVDGIEAEEFWHDAPAPLADAAE